MRNRYVHSIGLSDIEIKQGDSHIWRSTIANKDKLIAHVESKMNYTLDWKNGTTLHSFKVHSGLR